MKQSIWLTLIFLVCGSLQVTAQQNSKYWVFLKDKNTSNYHYTQSLSAEAIRNRTERQIPLVQYSDMPLNSEYVQQIGLIDGVQIKNYSKWFNAISAELSPQALAQVQKLPFVTETKLIYSSRCASQLTKSQDPDILQGRKPRSNDYSLPLVQMGIADMEKANLNAAGLTLGVIDAGFYGAHTNKNLKHLFESKSIVDTKDFVSPQRSKDVFFSEAATNDDNHGTNVLEMIAGYRLKNGVVSQQGFAHKAKFYLARTDHGGEEKRREEDNWVRALEWMDSLGVRLINSSLGYATGFDDPNDNYETKQIDGKTTMTTLAANLAFKEKGMFLVVSAGNEGDEPNWRILSAPADALHALSIGATGDLPSRQSYSSIGPEDLGYLKPNVSCFSATGTSFSAPAVMGFVACLIQKKPSVSNEELFELVQKSAALYPFGNNYVGYGFPNAKRAIALLEGQNLAQNQDVRKIKGNKASFKIKDTYNSDVLVFHKKDQKNVIEQEILTMKKNKALIKRYADAEYSTVIVNNTVFEIEWR
ncbi:MAG: hypothetical protein EAZ57_08785 [Cytophagales bacterium]|nr:MAG: hypothetical protein EAZ67_09595 [Cytophagales bacterium]TAF60121.1 MAG: hypothetical protein EAZ57_08785 [Cytophagales bacterium]